MKTICAIGAPIWGFIQTAAIIVAAIICAFLLDRYSLDPFAYLPHWFVVVCMAWAPLWLVIVMIKRTVKEILAIKGDPMKPSIGYAALIGALAVVGCGYHDPKGVAVAVTSLDRISIPDVYTSVERSFFANGFWAGQLLGEIQRYQRERHLSVSDIPTVCSQTPTDPMACSNAVEALLKSL